MILTPGVPEWVAQSLGLQRQPGPPIGEGLGLPLYPPPAFSIRCYWYDAYAPEIFMEGAYMASAGGFVSFSLAIGLTV